MDVLALLDKLDAYLSECSRLPLVGKLLVDEDEVFAILDDLRAALPQELEQAKWLLKERERILQEARKESEDIIKDAQGQIASLASESIIAKEARAQADDLMEKAKAVAKEINLGARGYADDLMKRVEDVLNDLLERVREGRRELSTDREPSAPKPVAEGLDGDEAAEEEGGGLKEADLSETFEDEEKPRAKRRWGRK
jgi:cell division septum initiation protein DivIVA